MKKLFICGDSTAASYDPKESLMVGWGQVVGGLLKDIAVENHAKAGRSTRTFLEEGRLQALDGLIRPGDLMLVQFAHNDENEKKPERYAAPWTAFSENLRIFADFARERGAVPVFLTPICMRVWENGVLQETHGQYPEVMRVQAEKLGVPLIDVYRESCRLVAQAGEEESKAFFMHIKAGEDERYPEGLSDNAHTRRAGAEAFARYVADGLIRLGLAKRF